MKSLKVIKRFNNISSDIVYGGSNSQGKILVNVQKIYDEYGEQEFANMFSKVYIHELLHCLIEQHCPAKVWSSLGEERVVMMMNGEDLFELGPYEKYYKGKRHGTKSNKDIRRVAKNKRSV